MDEPNTTLVPEVKSVRVSKRKALRLFIGRFVVDYVETFVGLVPVQIVAFLITPDATWLGEWKAYLLQLAGPALAALTSSLRRAWPIIRKWLKGDEEGDN